MDDVNSATSELQTQSDRVDELRTELEDAESAKQEAVDALRSATDNAESNG